jgi:HAMP domain-containing protein
MFYDSNVYLPATQPQCPPRSRQAPSQGRRRRRTKRSGKLLRHVICLLILLTAAFAIARGLSRIGEIRTDLAVNLSHRISQSGADTVQTASGGADGLTVAEMRSYIQSHSELYPEALQERAEKNEELVEYVYNYPTLGTLTPEIDLSAQATQDTVPLLIQWDSRWGYRSYGSGLIGYTGCGPTCLSMVALYLTGDATATPVAVAEYAENNGYYVSGSGSTWTLMSEGSAHFGLKATELPLDENRMAAQLAEGNPIICALGPGDFTDNGHFIVLTGYSDGSFTINDPNSPTKSAQSWSYERLSSQIKNIWAFTCA